MLPAVSNVLECALIPVPVEHSWERSSIRVVAAAFSKWGGLEAKDHEWNEPAHVRRSTTTACGECYSIIPE